MQKNLADAPNSQFVDWNKNLEAYTEGWHLVYANQCPWHIKSVQDLKAEASKLRTNSQCLGNKFSGRNS